MIPARAQLSLGLGLVLVLFSVTVGLLARAEQPVCTYTAEQGPEACDVARTGR